LKLSATAFAVAVGVPLITPELLIDKPGGNVPPADQVNVVAPDLSVAEIVRGEIAVPLTLLWFGGVAIVTKYPKKAFAKFAAFTDPMPVEKSQPGLAVKAGSAALSLVDKIP